MSDIANFDIRTCITDSMIETFDTLVSMEIEHADSEPPDNAGINRMVTAVNFVGDVTGTISIQVTSNLARLMMANRHATEPQKVEDDDKVKEMLVEISNIVGGRLKSALNDSGYICVISTPSLTSGTDFSVKPLGMDRFEGYIFNCQEERILVDVGLKVSQTSGEENASVKAGAAAPQAETTEIESTPASPPHSALTSRSPAAERTESRGASPDEPPAQETMTDIPPSTASKSLEDFDLELLLDIPLEIKVELGRARIQIQELLNLAPGSALKLVKLEGEAVDILANDTLIARGEVVVHREKYGIRVTEITSRIDRIRSFSI